MKLISVKILGGDFRSLAANKLYEFNYSFRQDRLSTKIFAGLNGSGKSNFLELLSEIFYFLEICHLETVPESEKSNKSFGFEIEYLLPFSIKDVYSTFSKELSNEYYRYIENNYELTGLSKVDFENYFLDELENVVQREWGLLNEEFITKGDLYVRIIKPLGDEPEYSIRNNKRTSEYRKIPFPTGSILPRKIIAYTSGQNELLSNPYYKLKYHYFKTFEEKNSLERIDEFAESHRLFFLDYSTNFSIFISNLLLADSKKINILKDVLKINDLQSFRMTINTDELYRKVIPVNNRLAGSLQKLKQCSTTWIEKKVGDFNLLIFDYLVNDATKNAFRFHFRTAFNLFKVFYELEIFNLYLVEKKSRDLMLQVHKSYNFLDEMSKPDPSRLVFRLEKIFIRKIIDESKPARDIYYKALSDGEHQFNEVVGTVLMMEQDGCLFLIDEPDTHFNPKWRAKLIKMLNYMAAVSFDGHGNIEKVRQQEIIVTTHSPFVISDSSSDDVYRFTRKNGLIEYDHPTIQMYGASISVILDEIFEKGETISEMAKKELMEMVDNIVTLDDLKKVVDRLNTEFGDSVEKFDLFSKLKFIKDEIERTKRL